MCLFSNSEIYRELSYNEILVFVPVIIIKKNSGKTHVDSEDKVLEVDSEPRGGGSWIV